LSRCMINRFFSGKKRPFFQFIPLDHTPGEMR